MVSFLFPTIGKLLFQIFKGNRKPIMRHFPVLREPGYYGLAILVMEKWSSSFVCTDTANLLPTVDFFLKNVTESYHSCDGIRQNLWWLSLSPRILLFASSLGPRILLDESSKSEDPKRRIRGGNKVAKSIQWGWPWSFLWTCSEDGLSLYYLYWPHY